MMRVLQMLLASLILPLTIPAVHAATGSRPNILLIVADDLGYADVGVHGCTDFATPAIDSIAKNGIRCTNGYVSSPLCAPSRAGFITGRCQDRFGFQINPSPGCGWGLPLAEKTMAEHLKPAGCRTGLFGKWHLGDTPELHPMKRGFDEFFGFLGGMHSYVQAVDSKWGPILRGNEPAKLKEYLTLALAREASEFIKRNADSPFFLYLAFNAPHLPMEAPAKYMENASHISDTRRRTYAAMVMALDDAIGHVLNVLRETKLENNTLVFFLSDNGGMLSEKFEKIKFRGNGSKNDPLRGGKYTVWEGGIRVPFFVQWKGRIPAGKTIDEPIMSLDILPTVLSAVGAEIKPDWKLDGVNLLPLLDGHETRLSRAPLCWKFSDPRFPMQSAIRSGDWKLVKVGSEGGFFDLQQDIGESKDRTAEHPTQAAKLKSTWDAWERELPPRLKDAAATSPEAVKNPNGSGS